MRIDDIKIFPCFAEHSPKVEKMQQKEQYFTETGLLQSQIILDSRGNLIDGYTSYLLAVKYRLQSVSVKYGKRQIVRANQKSGGKLYTWELPGLLIDRVHIGDKVLVRADRGIRTVTVAAVEDYSGQELESLKMVIRIKKRYSGEERRKTQGKEYAERLKSEAKEFIDGIGTESELDQRIIKLIYGFAQSGFQESMAGKGGAV